METKNIDANLIIAGNNDRTRFDKNALRELAISINENGLIQPLTVRVLDGTELYQIVAGERRYRAIRLLGWREVPCIVADLNDEEAGAVMLTENVSRNDLDPIDEANAYASRINGYGWTVEQCARQAGVSRVRVQFRLKLLKLRTDIQALVRSGDLTLGYAQIISGTGLNHNFQMIAVRKLRDNPHPTPAWFRRICNQLLEQQAQSKLFNAPLFGGPLNLDAKQEITDNPPLPSDTIPPTNGGTPVEIIKNQVSFWQKAADAWNEMGKNFKRDQCIAAAFALKSTLVFLT